MNATLATRLMRIGPMSKASSHLTRRSCLHWRHRKSITLLRFVNCPSLVGAHRSLAFAFLLVSHFFIGSQCLSILKSDASPEPDRIESKFKAWRTSLHPSLKEEHGSQPEAQYCRLVLLASSYRYECVIFRLLWQQFKSRDLASRKQAERRLRLATYELDILIGRALAYDLLGVLPMSLYL